MTAATATRGTSNGNDRGSTKDRRRRRAYLIETYRADADITLVAWPTAIGPTVRVWTGTHDDPRLERAIAIVSVPSARCYRCGTGLHDDVKIEGVGFIRATLTADRIIPGGKGGTYRRDNIRPACGLCDSSTGGSLSGQGTR